MSKTVKQIFDEEVDVFFSTMKNRKLFVENNTIIDSLVKGNEYNNNNQIVEENWDWFKQTLLQAASISVFQYNSKIINSQLYAVKYFTNINFMIAESVEEEIKFELKKYFISLKVADINEFINVLFSLPFEFTSLVVRYVANILAKDKKELLVPNITSAKESLEIILNKKDNLIKIINNISKGLESNFPINDVLLLLDVKAFYQNNPLNIGVLEYVIRMIKQANQKLVAEFGKDKVQLMQQQILVLPSYQKHLNDITKDTNNAYFTSKGVQNVNRQVTYDDLVTKYFNPEDYVPKTHNLNNKKEEEKSNRKEEEKQGVAAKQPSEEELMQQ